MYVHTSTSERLSRALAACNAAAPGKTDKPIEGALLLQTGTDELQITVVDTRTHQLRLVVPCQVVTPGAVLVPGEYLSKLVSRLGDQPLGIEIANNQLVVSPHNGDVHRFDLYQDEPDNFPIDPDLPSISAMVDADALTEALKAVLVAACENEQDIIFQAIDGTLFLYTSLWLTTKARLKISEPIEDFLFAVPKSSLSGGRLPAWSGLVNIHVGEDKIVFSQGEEHLILRRGSTEAPDVDAIDQVISTAPAGQLVVNMQAMKNRVHTVAIGNKQVCVLEVKGRTDKKLAIYAENKGAGDSNMAIPVSGSVVGTASKIKVDVNILEKALKTIDGDAVRLDFVDYVGEGKDISLRLQNDANPDKRQTLVLPLQS